MKLLIGLGNPGEKYEHTRHNAGFEVITCLEKKWGISVNKSMCHGLVGETRINSERIALIKPQTFMNLSGDCVADALRWYKVGPKDCMIFSDDIDLPLGQLRVRPFGGAGTHNGWRDILLKTGSDRFPRIRVGVGARPPEWDLADWVLAGYQTAEDRKKMSDCFERAAEAAESFILRGIEDTMNVFNRK